MRYRADHIHGFDILGVDRRPCDEGQKQAMLHAQKEAAVKQHVLDKASKKNKKKKRPVIKTKRRRTGSANKSALLSPFGSKVRSATTPSPIVVQTAPPIPASYPPPKE